MGMFAIGGSADGRTLNTIEVFDPLQATWNNWFNMPPMQTKRTLHGAAVGNGRIFVCGGYDGMRDMNTTESYCPVTNVWLTNKSWNLAQARSYLALCACKGSIYALGGRDRKRDSGPRAHLSVECFDLYSESWVPAPDMQTGRLGLTASHLAHPDGDDYVYACGGSDGADVLCSVERYNIREGCWSAAPPMGTPRLGHAAAVFNNKLYVIGGTDGKEPLDTFECFDPDVGQWGPRIRIGGQVLESSDPGIPAGH